MSANKFPTTALFNSLFLSRAVAFANLDFVSLTPMGCVVPITYHHQLLGYTLLPLVAMGLISLPWMAALSPLWLLEARPRYLVITPHA